MSETTQQQPGSGAAEPSSARLIMTLGLAGFFAGLVLVGAYLFTLPLIQANKARALEAAIYKVLPGCQSYKVFVLKDGELQEQADALHKGPSGSVSAIFAGFDAADKLTGFAIPAQETGFQDVISGIIGYDPVKKMIVGFEILESKETPGLGDKIFKDADFQKNFKGLETKPGIITVSKGKKTLPNEVEAITGATISSKAVVRLLVKGVKDWEKVIDDYLNKQTKQ